MKLPINPLLYLVSLACASGIALNIMGTLHPRISWDREEVEIREKVKELVERGSKVQPDIGQWHYDASNPFWELFKSANFTGYRAPEPVAAPTVKGDDTVQGTQDVDLRQKIDVVCLSYGGDYTRAVVQYHGDLNVEVPEEYRVVAPGPADVAPLQPQNGRGRRPPPLPSPSGTTAPLHHVDLGDHLWKPLHNFYLVEVAEDARSVSFENRGKEKVDNKFPRQEVPKNELGLPQESVEKLLQLHRRGGPTAPQTTTPEPAQAPSQWQDPGGESRPIHENEWHVSRPDLDYINQRGNKFIHEDVHLNDYSGGSGDNRVQGVNVRRLGQRARGLGVHEGDVLVSLNGTKVKNRAEAITLGKRLWRDGVRRFEAVFLRRGQEITIVHHFPNK